MNRLFGKEVLAMLLGNDSASNNDASKDVDSCLARVNELCEQSLKIIEEVKADLAGWDGTIIDDETGEVIEMGE